MILFNSIEELLEASKGIIGKTFGELDKLGYFQKPSMINDKGLLGKIVETGYYGYSNNNVAEADFKNIGVELVNLIQFIRFPLQKKMLKISEKPTNLFKKHSFQEISVSFQLLPKKKNAPLVLSTKSNVAGAYKRFMEGDCSTCFMLNKEFIYKKLLEAQKSQQFKK